MYNIIQESPDLIKNTSEYKTKVFNIKKKVKEKYLKPVLNEKKIIKKFKIILKSEIETRKKVRDITSDRNLY